MHKRLFQFGILLLSSTGWAQMSPTHPFSSYGIGDFNYSASALTAGLGNNHLAYVDSAFLNYANPSSYSRIAAGYPLFSLGLQQPNIQQYNNQGSQNVNKVYLNHLVLGFPFLKRFGLAMGLNPYANRSYTYVASEAVGNGSDTLMYTYTGKGTISRVFGGLSANIINQDSMVWSVGGNMGHLFGVTQNIRNTQLKGSAAGGQGILSSRMAGVQYELATTFSHQFNPKSQYVITGYYEPAQQWKGRFGSELYYTSNFSIPSLYQNLDSTFSDGYVSHGGAFGGGITLSKNFKRISKKNKEFDSRVDFILAYHQINYSQSSFRIADSSYNDLYGQDFRHFGVGIQYLPERDFYNKNVNSQFFSRISYRLGAYHRTLPFNQNGVTYSQFGTTFGIGIPILSQFSFSSVQLSLDLGERKANQPDALSEKFITGSVGLILSPSSADKWFRKVKLD